MNSQVIPEAAVEAAAGLGLVALIAISAWHLGRAAGMKEMLTGPKAALKPNAAWNKQKRESK